MALTGGAPRAAQSSCVSWTERGLVLQVWKALAPLQACSAARQASVWRSQACLCISFSFFTNGFQERRRIMGKMLLGTSTGLLKSGC